MAEQLQNDAMLARLPTGFVDRFAKPVAHFLRVEASAGSVLLLFTVVALALSNSPWSHSFLSAWDIPLGFRIGSFEFDRSLKGWINDALMTLFFFLVALELKRELVLGELNNPRRAALSIAVDQVRIVDVDAPRPVFVNFVPIAADGQAKPTVIDSSCTLPDHQCSTLQLKTVRTLGDFQLGDQIYFTEAFRLVDG
jgi:Na+/H+ antiporter NhaA